MECLVLHVQHTCVFACTAFAMPYIGMNGIVLGFHWQTYIDIKYIGM